MKFYGLKINGELIGFDSSANEDNGECVGVTFTLCKYTHENIWLVSNKDKAIKASVYSTEWYNACYESPQNPYVGQCEVFEVDI